MYNSHHKPLFPVQLDLAISTSCYLDTPLCQHFPQVPSDSIPFQYIFTPLSRHSYLDTPLSREKMPVPWKNLELEPTNIYDKYAGRVKKDRNEVGHLEKGSSGRFAKTIFFFLRANTQVRAVLP